MSSIKDLNGVQYGDYEGFASLDTHTGIELVELCGQKGIDLDSYFPVGFGLCGNEGFSQDDETYMTVYLIDKSIAGKNYDDIEKYINTNSGNINLVSRTFQFNYSELTKYVKRFDITVFNKLMDVINDVEVTEE